MEVTFVETREFTATVEVYFVSDQAYATFQRYLAQMPERGQVITGCGGLRKVRWPDPRRGKGKRGGLRIIYLHVPAVDRVLLLDIYDKDEAEDLSTTDRAALSRLADEYRDAALAEHRRRER